MAKLEKEQRLMIAIGLSLVFMCIEIVGGYMANSIAIFSDAAHLLTDIAGFAIALIAAIAAKSPGTKFLTFGFARAEVFGALGSILSLWIITAFLLYAALLRAIAWFENTADDVNGFLMFVVACFGVLVNLCLGFVFHEDHGGDFHPAHSGCSHDHGHSSGGSEAHDDHDGHSHTSDHAHSYQQIPVIDLEKCDSKQGDHDHSHDHRSKKESPVITKEVDSSHEHNHSHKDSQNERTHLLSNAQTKSIGKVEPFAFAKAPKCGGGHAHDHGHDDDAPSPAVVNPVVEMSSTVSAHDHSGHSHAGHDHSAHSHGHEEKKENEDPHAGHDHSHGAHGHGHYAATDSTTNNASNSSGHADSNHHPTDVNIEAAYLHVLTDLIQSIGVAIAGAVLWWRPEWQIIDPICTVLFSIVALRSTLPLISRVGMILFEGIPSHVDWEVVMDKLKAVPGVEDVHDLHIWSISSKSTSLTCHIRASRPQEVLLAAHNVCRKLGIDHATIQVHDANDARFCYSQTCDDEEIAVGLLSGGPPSATGTTGAAAVPSSNGASKKKACV